MADLDYWTLEEALPLIRRLQPSTRQYGYHLCLGGGVLNRGSSQKDLDLYFLSMGDNITCDPKVDPEGLKGMLESLWGAGQDMLRDYPDRPIGRSEYLHKIKFTYSDLRIDVFITGVKDDDQTDPPAEDIHPRGRPLQNGGIQGATWGEINNTY